MKLSFYYCFIMLFICHISYGETVIEHEEVKAKSSAVELEAKVVNYDPANYTVSAEGNVEVKFDGNTLTTESLLYNRLHEELEVGSRFKLQDNIGNVFEADSANITKSLDNSTINNVTATFDKQGAVHAERLNLIDENKVSADNLQYTLCDLCNNSFDSEQPPLWSISGKKFKLNRTSGTVSITHPIIHLWGTPVMYLPYVSLPVSKARRKTGFLAPIAHWEEDFGVNLQTPLYFNIAPQADLTITPWFLQKYQNQLALEFRHLTPDGYHIFSASAAYYEAAALNDRLRAHIRARGRTQLFENQDTSSHNAFGYNILRLKDDFNTYLKKYRISDNDILNSEVYFDIYSKNSFFTLKALQFQGLRSFDEWKITPQAYPKLEYYKQHKIARDLYWNYHFDLLNLYRNQGRNVKRAVAETKVEGLKYKAKHSVSYFASLRADYYQSKVNNPDGVQLQNFNAFRGITPDLRDIDDYRIFPSAGAHISLPFYAQFKRTKFLLEPNIALNISPVLSARKQFINEDSQSPEIQINNLFLRNIYKGKDKIQSGSRVSYGVKSLYRRGEYEVLMQIGQQYSIDRNNNNFGINSGLARRLSDYVSYFAIKYGDLLQFSNKSRVDQANFEVESHETMMHLDYKSLSFNLELYGLGKKALRANTDLSFRNELRGIIDWRFNDGWTMHYFNRSRVGPKSATDKKFIAQGVDFIYNNKCLEFSVGVNRNYATLNDLTPSTNYRLSVNVPFN